MSKWNEMKQANFLSGTKMPKEVLETEQNEKILTDTLNCIRKVEENITKFRASVSNIRSAYITAKDEMDIERITRLNSEAKIRNKIIDDNFEMTLNGLSAKEEGETKAEAEKRITEGFKLPLIK